MESGMQHREGNWAALNLYVGQARRNPEGLTKWSKTAVFEGDIYNPALGNLCPIGVQVIRSQKTMSA
jgi:hypothetical protein